MNDEIKERLLDELLLNAKQTSAIRRIASRLTTLKGKTREAAQFLLANIDSLTDMTIDQIAAACGASRATIARMSKELGYDNFSQLRCDLLGTSDEDADSTVRSTPLFESMKRCISMLLDTYSTIDEQRINQAAELLVTRTPIAVYGGAMSGGMARVIQNRFRWMGLSAYASSDVEGLVHDLRQRTGVLLCVSHLGATPNVLRVVSQARHNNVPTILLVNLEGAPACKEADVVLPTNITSYPSHGYDVLARTSQLYVLELLCEAMASRMN